MSVFKYPVIGYLKYLLLAGVASVAFSCVNQDLGECPPDPGPDPGPGPGETIRQLLYLRVADGSTRADGDADGELDDIMVYLFDRNEKLVDTIPYTQAMIDTGMPVDLSGRGLEGGYATVWANLGSAVQTDPAQFGDDIDELEVRMLPNEGRADYYLCPGDIFFGYKHVVPVKVDDVTEADTVWLARKNSRLNITVRGLTERNADDYYFKIGALYSAYDFEGTPQEVSRNIWEQGQFNDLYDFVSPEPYQMIHNAPDHVYSPTSRVLIEIYRLAETRGDTLIASSDMDTSGEYIRLEQGKTSNVLIVLDGATGDVTVRLVITPWEEIHQWSKW